MSRQFIAAIILAVMAESTAMAKPDEVGEAATGCAQTMESVAFLTGHWKSENPVNEEVWLAPANGLMLGMARSLSANGASFEYLRIEARDGAIVYVAQPGRAVSPTDFPMTDCGPGFATFENPDHDFPQRLHYEMRGVGILTATVEGRDGHGVMSGFTLIWTRVE
ncbi:MAG TPA: DUF6265 family protein [Micropepsaceae bacterium]|nr:DUF6265 family protein [Micropepsaceae bacterium]